MPARSSLVAIAGFSRPKVASWRRSSEDHPNLPEVCVVGDGAIWNDSVVLTSRIMRRACLYDFLLTIDKLCSGSEIGTLAFLGKRLELSSSRNVVLDLETSFVLCSPIPSVLFCLYLCSTHTQSCRELLQCYGRCAKTLHSQFCLSSRLHHPSNHPGEADHGTSQPFRHGGL